MPLRDPVFNPPFNIVRASHVELGVSDLAKSRAFYVDCLGYIVSDEDKDALYLRGVEERNHHSVVLRKSTDIAALAIGFKVGSEEDLDKAAEWLAARKLPVSWPNVPFQGRTLRTVDPVGMPIDLYFKMDRVKSMLQKYAAYQGARIQRIDHINCFTPDVQASYDFYTELGFRLTETTETEGADPKLWAVWMQRRGSAHDLAFTNGRGPRLHHIGVWNANALDILHTCDVMATSGYLANMERGPGRHGIANAFFLYVRDPDGHRVELFTSDYLTVDPDHEPIRWTLDDPQRQTLWGHPAPKSWFEEGSPFRDVPVREPVLRSAAAWWRGNENPRPLHDRVRTRPHYGDLISPTASRDPLHRNIHHMLGIESSGEACRSLNILGASPDRQFRRGLALSLVALAALIGAGAYWWTRPAATAGRAAGAARSRDGRGRGEPQRADLSRRARHRVGLQHRDDPQPDHRHAADGELHRGPGGASGRHARGDRSAAAAGRARPRRSPGRRRTRRS